MDFLQLLEGLRVPALDRFFSLVTHLGEETAFLVMAILVFWCFSKRAGYYVFLVGFFGTLSNQFLKLLCRIPRPWILDPDFSIVESARAAATGYSFPSGHSQSSVGTLGAIAVYTKRKWLKAVCIVFALLVPFSRLYLGVHTPLDVGVGAGSALLLLALLWPAFCSESRQKKCLPRLLGAVILCAAAYLIFVLRYPFPADVDAHNLASGTKNAWTLCGCCAALPLILWLDQRYIHFEVEAPLLGQVLKMVLGLALILGLKAGAKPLLHGLLPAGPADAVRYFLIVTFAGGIWPLTFRFFAKLGKKQGKN